MMLLTLQIFIEIEFMFYWANIVCLREFNIIKVGRFSLFLQFFIKKKLLICCFGVFVAFCLQKFGLLSIIRFR